MTLGVILAGGASQRMGADKALIEVEGRSMAQWIAASVLRVCETAIVVGRDGDLAGLPGLADTQMDVRGPLAGLHTALESRAGSDVLLVAVDQPFVQHQTLRRLIGLATDTAVVPIDGARQVTCAMYPASWASEVANEVASQGSIQSLLDRMSHRRVEADEWSEWGEDGRSWFSVDTPEAITEGLARYGAPGQ